MYEEYWGLSEMPFENTPDPRFLYYSTQHEEALTRLMYVIKKRKGAGMLTGVFGCGKTVLARALLQELKKNIYRVAFIINPQLAYVELLRSIAHHLGAKDLPIKKTEVLTDFLLQVLSDILFNNMKDGKETVIIIDEAHVIEDKAVFEELRLLLNFQLDDRFLLTLLLLGQPELKEEVDGNKQLAQRIALAYHLEPLSEEDTLNYITHRLCVANRTEPIFDSSAVEAIYENSGGIPRRINQICDMSLFTGFGKKATRIDREIIQEAVDSLGV